MFIHVVYKDAPELSQTIRKMSTADEDESIEKTLLVNPNCPVRIMLEYIRKKCKLGKFTNFDLCDESGALKQLFCMPTFAYATDLFEHKKQYYIIVKKQECDKRVSVIPQVNRDNRLYMELKEKVKKFILTGPSPVDAVTPKTTPPGKITPTSKSSTPPGKVTPPKKK